MLNDCFYKEFIINLGSVATLVVSVSHALFPCVPLHFQIFDVAVIV